MASLADTEQAKQESTAHLPDCKQIESKVAALSIAAEETFSFTACFFSFNHSNTYSPLCHLTLTGDIEATCCDPDKTNIDALWPAEILHAPRIAINIYLQDSKPIAWRHASDFFGVYHFFSSLASLLTGSALQKQSVKIKFLEGDVPVEKLLHANVLASLDAFLTELKVEPEGLWVSKRDQEHGE